MITTVIVFFFTVSFLLAIVLTNRTGAKVNGNMLLGVTIPYNEKSNLELNKIVTDYRRAYLLTGAAFLILMLPLIALHRYISLQLLYVLVWIMALLGINSWIINLFSKKAYAFKRDNNWYTGSKHILSIDTEASRLKSKMITPKKWFVPAVMISLIPFAALLVIDDFKITNGMLAAAPLINLATCFGAYLITTKERTVVYSGNAEVNIALNKVYRQQWSRVWVLASTLGAIVFSLVFWQVSYGAASTYELFFLIIGASTAIIYSVVKAYHNIRSKRNVLLAVDNSQVYVDDDQYWVGGSYYNENDNRSFIEKRIGYGTTVNGASKAGKAIPVILAVVVLLVLVLINSLVQIEFGDINVTNEKGTITLSAPGYSYSFHQEQVTAVSLLDQLPAMSKRYGFDGPSLYYGRYNITGYGTGEIYIHLQKGPYILVELEDTTIIINSKKSENTRAIYDTLESKRH